MIPVIDVLLVLGPLAFGVIGIVLVLTAPKDHEEDLWMERVLEIGLSILFFSVISMLLIGGGYFMVYQILANPLPGMCR